MLEIRDRFPKHLCVAASRFEHRFTENGGRGLDELDRSAIFLMLVSWLCQEVRTPGPANTEFRFVPQGILAIDFFFDSQGCSPMICHEYKCIFVHVPKAAGMSIEHFFLKLVGLTWETRAPLLLRLNDDERRGPERLAHLYADEYVRYGYIDGPAFQEYFKFSFVRNPWARLVSEYRWRHYDLRYTFSEFIARGLPEPSMKDDYRHIVPQCEFTHDKDGKQIVDFVGRFERLQADFTTVCGNLGIDDSGLPYVNPSDRKAKFGIRDNIRRLVSRIRQPVHANYIDYYDNKLRDKVGEMYAKDIATFGYSFEDGI